MKGVGEKGGRIMFRRISRFLTQTQEAVAGTENVVEKAGVVGGRQDRAGDQANRDQMKSGGKAALGRHMPSRGMMVEGGTEVKGTVDLEGSAIN